MSTRQKIVYIILVTLLSWYAVGGSAMARELSHFYSDTPQIGFVPVRSIWATNLNGFTALEFSGYLNHAVSQWSGAGINTFSIEMQHDAAIEVWGGTRATLEEQEPRLRDFAALAVYVTASLEGTHTHLGRSIQNFRILKTRVFVPLQPWYYGWWSANHYRQAFTHELGHALGWIGHSADRNDVMHNSPGQRTNLTVRDRTHLRQNYN